MIKFYFEPRDLWVGFFWDRRIEISGRTRLWVYCCLFPTLVIRVIL